MKYGSLIAALAVSLMAGGCKKAENQPKIEPSRIRIQEGYSDDTIDALQKREGSIANSTVGMSLSRVQSIRSITRTWPTGKVITVAFKGGSNELRQKIASATKPWTDLANITFDFGYDPNTSSYREWSTSDTQYRADIRISFDSLPDPGYWSLIGKDSLIPPVGVPNKASMNFEGFTTFLPEDWSSTVLHEFGHALGFAHEHQSPNSPCDQEYRWFDDPGYVRSQDVYKQFVPDGQGRKPGIYTVLEGAPNGWSKKQIDFNLKQFANSTDWYLSAFDQGSIMKYVFQGWMYQDVKLSKQSGCFGPPNIILSPQDQKAAASAYPRDPVAAKLLLKEKIRVSREMLARKNLSPELRLEFNSISADLKKSRASIQ